MTVVETAATMIEVDRAGMTMGQDGLQVRGSSPLDPETTGRCPESRTRVR
jgi:hypothetical protein